MNVNFTAKIKVIKDSKLVTVGKKVIDTAKTVTIPKIKSEFNIFKTVVKRSHNAVFFQR